MGNSLPSPKEVTSAIAPRSLKSFPGKVKKFAKGNLTALIAKKGWKLHPRFHLKLFFPNSQMTLQSLLKFMHRNRARMASLKKLSVFLNSADIIPLLMTSVSIRPLIKSLGQRVSRLRNLEAAEIGTSQMNAFSIEETLMQSLTKTKKITSLTIGIPDNQNKINVIAKKLGYLKWIKTLNLNFYVENASIKPILNVLKSCFRLQELTINLKDCGINSETVLKLGEVIKKMRKLAHLVIHLENTNIQDADLKYLYDTIENESKVGSFKINTKGCPNLTWYTRAKIYARKNMSTNDLR